jgi:hypothetical protein
VDRAVDGTVATAVNIERGQHSNHMKWFAHLG